MKNWNPGQEVSALNENDFSGIYSDMLISLDVRLRDKLSVLMPALDLLEKRIASGETDAAVLRYLGEARRAAFSILRMAKNLGDQAKYAADYSVGDPVQTDLAELFSAIAAETRKLAVYKQADITFSCSETPFYAFADPAMLSRLLYNLLSNAVLHGSGDVGVELTREEGFILLKVRNGTADDTGALSRLYTGRKNCETPEGTLPPLGMGLSVASAIVRQSGGTMMASSDSENETVITISLPDLPGEDEMEFGIPESPCTFPLHLVELSDFPAYNKDYNLKRSEGEDCATSMQ
jgi:signal transduction histidine kinase